MRSLREKGREGVDAEPSPGLGNINVAFRKQMCLQHPGLGLIPHLCMIPAAAVTFTGLSISTCITNPSDGFLVQAGALVQPGGDVQGFPSYSESLLNCRGKCLGSNWLSALRNTSQFWMLLRKPPLPSKAICSYREVNDIRDW